MDLTSHHPFWFIQNGLIRSFPPLESDQRCDVAVIGAGITGAMMAQRLASLGLSVIVVDRRDVCLGSTSATTALLQYEIDLPLVEMAEKIGLENAERAYRLSYSAIDHLTTLASSISSDCGFQKKKSLYVAHDQEKAEMLQREADARQRCGINVSLIGAKQLSQEFHVDATAALVSTQAASCDAYRFAHALLANACEAGARVFDRTSVDSFESHDAGIRMMTNRGPVISAQHVVFATGYEAQTMLCEKVVDLKSTYAVVSQPLESLAPWDEDWMMWEAADPYLYLRATADHRLLVGGEDDPFRDPDERDARLPRKAERIREKVRKLLPALAWEVEFAWAGTFGETKDGLAYIGSTSEYPNCYFALGFGGNGITFSAIAADILADLLTGKQNDNVDLFRFGR